MDADEPATSIWAAARRVVKGIVDDIEVLPVHGLMTSGISHPNALAMTFSNMAG